MGQFQNSSGSAYWINILSVLRIFLGFCIYAASQIHDSNVVHVFQQRNEIITSLDKNLALRGLSKAPPGGLRSGAQRHEARGFRGLPPF